MATVPYAAAGFDAPAALGAAVTPDDSADLATPSRGLYVGGAGAVVVYMAADAAATPTAVTFAGVAAGSTLPIRARRVLSTGTTATGIVALW